MDSDHVMIVAPHGTGARVYAEALADDDTGSIIRAQGDFDREISRIWELARCSPRDPRRIPFRAPHHSASPTAMFGSLNSGYNVRPGEVSLAHGGVLFLENATHFAPYTLKMLRHVLDSGKVDVHGLGWTRVCIPASFRLVLDVDPKRESHMAAFRGVCRTVDEQALLKWTNERFSRLKA